MPVEVYLPMTNNVSWEKPLGSEVMRVYPSRFNPRLEQIATEFKAIKEVIKLGTKEGSRPVFHLNGRDVDFYPGQLELPKPRIQVIWDHIATLLAYPLVITDATPYEDSARHMINFQAMVSMKSTIDGVCPETKAGVVAPMSCISKKSTYPADMNAFMRPANSKLKIGYCGELIWARQIPYWREVTSPKGIDWFSNALLFETGRALSAKMFIPYSHEPPGTVHQEFAQNGFLHDRTIIETLLYHIARCNMLGQVPSAPLENQVIATAG